MELTEHHHAYLSAQFYRYLQKSALPMWEETFLLAVETYGEQRGRRMALRALRDGQALDFAAYRHYAEWEFTDEFVSSCPSPFFYEAQRGEDYAYVVTRCPWNDEYRRLGLSDGGDCYCSVLDKSIARGFNPRLTYLVERRREGDTLFCRHTHVHAVLDRDGALGAPNPADQRPLGYHCAHLLAVFRATLESVYGQRGTEICRRVLEDFSAAFGADAATALSADAQQDFLRI